MQVTVTFDPTKKWTAAAIAKALRGQADALTTTDEPEAETDEIVISKMKKKTKPATTVSDDEDEDFGKKPLKAKDLGDESDEDTYGEQTDGEDEESAETEDETEEEEPTVSFKDVRAALNKYGEKHPDQARAILAGFNIKSPKELSAEKNAKYWEPIYRKVMAKIKATKK